MLTEQTSLRSNLLQQLASAGLPFPNIELAALWHARSGDPLPLNARSKITSLLKQQLEEDIKRRVAREPVARILGKREFYSIEFKLNDACLIPRPESETMLEAIGYVLANKAKPIRRMLELGCGSGCLTISLAISLAVNLAVNLAETLKLGKRVYRISACDKSRKALFAARKNAKLQAPNSPIKFFVDDWSKYKKRASFINTPLDLIFSNPPYLRRKERQDLQSEVQRFDPLLALDGGFDGLDCLRVVCMYARKSLRIGGYLLLEHAPNQQYRLARFAKSIGYLPERVFYDLGGQARITVLRLIAKRKGHNLQKHDKKQKALAYSVCLR